jgi:nanoRNase/pAp phosphatase (c-di-AMP/oligoRNAs hydrolase)
MFFSQHIDRHEYILTFRSSTVDVGSIAQMFGGGGHKLASACSISTEEYNIEDLFMKNSLPRSKKQ